MKTVEFITSMGLYNGSLFVILVIPFTGGLAIALMILTYDHLIKKILDNDKLTNSLLFQGFLYYLFGAIIWFWLIG